MRSRAEKVGTILSSLASAATLYGLLMAVITPKGEEIAWYPTNAGYIVTTIVLLVVCLIPAYFEFTSGPKRMSENDANKKMKAVLRLDKRIYIFTQNLSWVDDEVKEIIRAKTDPDIHVFIPSERDAADILREIGCDVVVYGEKYPTLQTRFTIVDPNAGDCRFITAYNVSNEKVMLHETTQASELAWYYANDLRRVIEKIVSDELGI